MNRGHCKKGTMGMNQTNDFTEEVMELINLDQIFIIIDSYSFIPIVRPHGVKGINIIMMILVTIILSLQ